MSPLWSIYAPLLELWNSNQKSGVGRRLTQKRELSEEREKPAFCCLATSVWSTSLAEDKKPWENT